jgi:hypothetical protein
VMGGIARFLKLVKLPTLPPYGSDTSINFFLGVVKRALALPKRAVGGIRYNTGWGG